jgi:transposase-like protein
MIDLSYPTILKSLEVLRLSIIANQADSKTWLDLVYFGPEEHLKHEKQNPIIFGIIESGHEVRIDILGKFPVKNLPGLKLRMLCQSSIYYTDEYPPYSFLLFHDHNKIHDLQDDTCSENRGFNHESNFLKFTRKLTIRHHGIPEKKFPQYLKEIEFRYRHRDRSIFKQLCHFLVSFVPRR